MDVLARMGLVRGRDLKSMAARRTGDKNHLSVSEAMKALEEMDAAQRNPLPGAAVAAGEGDFLEEPAERVHGHGPMARAGLKGLRGWPAKRKISSMRLCGPKATSLSSMD